MGAKRPTELGGQQWEQADRTNPPLNGFGFGARKRGDAAKPPPEAQRRTNWIGAPAGRK